MSTRYKLGLLCAIYGNFDVNRYFSQLYESLLEAKQASQVEYMPTSINLYIVTDTPYNKDKITDAIKEVESKFRGAYIETDITIARLHGEMSIGFMRSYLLKYILGQDDLLCQYYFFLDADDYVTSRFFVRMFEQLDQIEYQDGTFYQILGFNTTDEQDSMDPDKMTSRYFGGYPIYGDYRNPLDVLLYNQAVSALWGYVFTPACFKHYLDLDGCYEDTIFVLRCMENQMYKQILNIGYVHRNSSNTSLMATKKELPEMDRRNIRLHLGFVYKRYKGNPNPALKNSLLYTYNYYKARI